RVLRSFQARIRPAARRGTSPRATRPLRSSKCTHKRFESEGQTEGQMSAINVLESTDIADRVSSVLAARLHVHGDRIAEAATFEGDLGATSLDMVELIMSLEDEFRIEISDRDSEGLRTVGDVLALIRIKLH